MQPSHTTIKVHQLNFLTYVGFTFFTHLLSPKGCSVITDNPPPEALKDNGSTCPFQSQCSAHEAAKLYPRGIEGQVEWNDVVE